MAKYIITRLLAAALTLFVILTIAFCVVRLMPGSVYDDPNLDPAITAMLEQKAHLDKPLPVQYLYFLKGVMLEGDWGTSVKIEPGVPAFRVISGRIPVSLALNLAALVIAVPLGFAAGIAAALYRSRWPDTLISLGVVLFISVPSFVFAALLQYTLAFRLGWFPILYQPTAGLGLRVLSSMLPVTALTLHPTATIARYLRGELIEVLDSEFMTLARTKGLTRRQAVLRHGLRNAALPMVNIILPMFAHILGGSMVIERLFSIPGVGGTMIRSIGANDHSLTVATLIFYALISVVTMLAVDICYGLVDPRVRLGGGKE